MYSPGETVQIWSIILSSWHALRSHVSPAVYSFFGGENGYAKLKKFRKCAKIRKCLRKILRKFSFFGDKKRLRTLEGDFPKIWWNFIDFKFRVKLREFWGSKKSHVRKFAGSEKKTIPKGWENYRRAPGSDTTAIPVDCNEVQILHNYIRCGWDPDGLYSLVSTASDRMMLDLPTIRNVYVELVKQVSVLPSLLCWVRKATRVRYYHIPLISRKFLDTMFWAAQGTPLGGRGISAESWKFGPAAGAPKIGVFFVGARIFLRRKGPP